MKTIQEFQALTTACYDAALGNATWGDVLGNLGRAFGSTHVTLLQQRTLDTAARVIAFSGFDSSTIASYETYYKHRNVLLKALNQPSNAPLRREGVVRTSHMLCPDEEFHRTEYFNDFLKPMAVRRIVATNLFERDAVQLSVFQESLSPPTRRQLRGIAMIAPHLRRALQLQQRLNDASVYRSALEDYLARISRGAALLDGAGAVAYANDALRRMFAARDGLSCSSSRFEVVNVAAARKLATAVAAAVLGGDGGEFAVPRPSGAAPYHVLVSPLGTAGVIGSHRYGVMVIVSDPAHAVNFDRPLLQEMYGLTATECDVACRIANGNSVEALAEQMGTAPGTVRTHLKRVLQKTQTHRQADLVRQLLLSRTLP